jgi:hypothetical protein
MKPLSSLALAGAVALAIGGGAVAAEHIKNSHVLTVRLPGGGIEQIRYTGDVAPTVRIAPGGLAIAAGLPIGPGVDPAFARLEQISAMMDRQAAAMFGSMNPARLATGPGGLTTVDIGRLPAGARGWSMISTTSGSGMCTRTVEYSSTGDGRAPRVVSRSSGDCTAGGRSSGPASAVPTRPADGLVQTSYAADARQRPAAAGEWH